ncbi:MAG TPA: flavodoxin domain-containing protein [Thermoplasmata archaeon]|nr:flavodoxin domain-containing protein [Thermoplasmata archaeon]
MNRRKVLVAYATRNGSTAGIAGALGDELRTMELDVDVRPVREVPDVRPYGAVILGSAIYWLHWRKEALRFGRRHAEDLRGRAVWLFGSGPLDRSAERKDIPAVRGAARLAALLRARGHVTFGGRLAEDGNGMMAAMARGNVKQGNETDFRNFEQIRNWARRIGVEIKGLPA